MAAGVDGQGGLVEFGGDSGGLADVGEIGGEAVAEVDGGGGQGMLGEPEALSDARLRVEVRGQQCLEAGGNGRRLRTSRFGARAR